MARTVKKDVRGRESEVSAQTAPVDARFAKTTGVSASPKPGGRAKTAPVEASLQAAVKTPVQPTSGSRPKTAPVTASSEKTPGAGSKTPSPQGGVAGGDPSPSGLWFCNWKIWLEARRLLDEAMEPLGLKSREFWLLVIAGAGDISQHEMADLCGLDPSSLVPILDGMERRGLLHRQRNPNDRRVQWVKRTEEGDRMYARALPRAHAAEAHQLAPLSAADRSQLVAAMQKLIQHSK